MRPYNPVAVCIRSGFQHMAGYPNSHVVTESRSRRLEFCATFREDEIINRKWFHLVVDFDVEAFGEKRLEHIGSLAIGEAVPFGTLGDVKLRFDVELV